MAKKQSEKIDIQKHTDGKALANSLASKYKLTIDVNEVELLSTGIAEIDEMLGGGLPKGRFAECAGPESGGKTTLALAIAASVQKAGGVCIYVDVEHALDPSWAVKQGINWDTLGVLQPDTAQDALSIIEDAAKGGADLIILDSLAAMTTEQEMAGDLGDSHVGLVSRLIGQFYRRAKSTVAQSGSAVLAINQFRSNIGVMYGPSTVTPGGWAPRYYSSVRLECRRGEHLKDEVGVTIKVKSVKNKVAPPFQEATFDILFDTGIDYEGSLLSVAVGRGIVEQNGSWYANTLTGEKLPQGKLAASQWLRDNPEEYANIKAAL